MKRSFLLVVAVLMAVIAFAQEMQRFEVKVGDFNKLVVVDNINVVYACNADSAGLAVFRSEPQLVNQLIFRSNGKGKLSVLVGTDSVSHPNLPVIKLYSSYLQEAVNDGDSTLVIESVAPAATLKFKLSDNGNVDIRQAKATNIELAIITGCGKITAAGDCTNLSIRNMGTGEVNAEAVKSKNVQCLMLGTGKSYCNVSGGVLSIKGSGTGKVYYRGIPKEIKSLQLGSIKAINLDAVAE